MKVIGQKNGIIARKPHRCCWCGEHINCMEKYDAWSCVDGGSVSRVRVHPECHAAWDYALAHIDRDYYSENVGLADHRRGCACEQGRAACECGMPAYGGDNKEAR